MKRLETLVSAVLRDNDPLDPWLTESHWDDDYWRGEAALICELLDPAMLEADVRAAVVAVLGRVLPPAVRDDGTDDWRTARLDAVAAAISAALQGFTESVRVPDQPSILVCRALIDKTLQPLPIWVEVGPDAPGWIHATWLGIIRHTVDDRPATFELALFDESGIWKTGFPCDTPLIALNQAQELVGDTYLTWRAVEQPIAADGSAPVWEPPDGHG